MTSPAPVTALVRVTAALLLIVTVGLTEELPPVAAARHAAVPEGAGDWKQIDAGGNHTCGIRTNGHLYCWGFDFSGQLGNGGPGDSEPSPVEVHGGFANWTAVSAGQDHTCARRSTGRLYCWGSDLSGQLGNGGAVNTNRITPVEVAGGHTTWGAPSAGLGHTCARRTTGRLYCWGFDATGQLGNGGANADTTTPVPVAGGHTTWTQVSAGGNHTCGRRGTGRLYCWGQDFSGQLGNGGANADKTTPVQVSGGITSWTTVSAGIYHTCGRRASGRLYCWGADDSGQLGDDAPSNNKAAPVEVAGGSTLWTAVSAGQTHTCARRREGPLFCWGDDDSGRLGDDPSITDHAEPVQVAGTWKVPAVGGSHTCALRADLSLYCWGDDGSSQLGNGLGNVDQHEPVEVVG